MQEPLSVRSQLRDATRPAHARVDALFRDGFAESGTYAGYLAGMHGFLGAARHVRPGLDADLRRLQDDLDTLGLAPPRLPPALPVAPGDALGWRYVIDGSTLGARVLLREAAALGHDGGRGATFLAHHAAGTAWEATRHALDTYAGDADARRRLCAAADRAFAVAHDALRSALDTHRSALPA